MTNERRYAAGSGLIVAGGAAFLFAQMTGFPAHLYDAATVGGLAFAAIGFISMVRTGIKEHLQWLRRKNGLLGRRE